MTLTARIAAVRPSLEATPFAIVTLEIANAGDRACVITGYRIAWGSGAFEQRSAAIALAPYETKTYVVRMSATWSVIQQPHAWTSSIRKLGDSWQAMTFAAGSSSRSRIPRSIRS